MNWSLSLLQYSNVLISLQWTMTTQQKWDEVGARSVTSLSSDINHCQELHVRRTTMRRAERSHAETSTRSTFSCVSVSRSLCAFVSIERRWWRDANQLNAATPKSTRTWKARRLIAWESRERRERVNGSAMKGVNHSLQAVIVTTCEAGGFFRANLPERVLHASPSTLSRSGLGRYLATVVALKVLNACCDS